MTLTPSVRKLCLAVHITASAGWIGALGVFLAHALASLISKDDQIVRIAAFLERGAHRAENLAHPPRGRRPRRAARRRVPRRVQAGGPRVGADASLGEGRRNHACCGRSSLDRHGAIRIARSARYNSFQCPLSSSG
jgi:hypothetical protein